MLTVADPNLLIGADLFGDLDEEGRRAVMNAGSLRRLPAGRVVFSQGDPGVTCHTLLEGRVKILQSRPDGGQSVIRFIGPGEMFGTLPLFTDHRFPADAVTIEPAIMLAWRETDLMDLMARYPAISLNVIGVLGTRMAQLQERVRELTTQRAEQRMAHAILRLAAQAGRDSTCGATIEIPLRRKDLAEFAGTTLHTASRMVSAWEKAGLLANNGQRLVIHDLAALRALAEGHRD